MVIPNHEQKECHSVQELTDYAQNIHLALVDWAATPAERTCVIGIIEQSESILQAYNFIVETGANK